MEIPEELQIPEYDEFAKYPPSDAQLEWHLMMEFLAESIKP